jgi:hypothetical protein
MNIASSTMMFLQGWNHQHSHLESTNVGLEMHFYRVSMSCRSAQRLATMQTFLILGQKSAYHLHHPLRKVTLWSRCPIFIEKSMAQVCGEMEWISNGAIRKPP